MVRINWTAQAVIDLKEIAEYISKDSKKYGSLQVQRIKNRTQILKTNSYSGQILEFYCKKEIRQLVEGNYLIVYRIIDESRVDILTIHHSARDLGKRIDIFTPIV
jgi:addiction module RelE/StbE family toxin